MSTVTMADVIAIQELMGVAYVLNIVGFTLPVERASIMSAGLNEFQDFRFLE